MDPISGLKRAYQPLISHLYGEGWVKSSENKIKFEFGEGSSGGEVVLVASREEEGNSVVVRATINVDLDASEGGLVRISRERKWLLPVDEEGEEHHLEAKVVGQEL